ncbi:MAG: SpoIIE family protein phosphatase [Succinivibrio sp.]|nr:SpoIIE family protein phosphatase [Succinivibrio sp.]
MRTRVITLLVVCCLVLAAFVCVYAATVLRESSLESQARQQEATVALIGDTIKAKLETRVTEEVQKGAEVYDALRRQAAYVDRSYPSQRSSAIDFSNLGMFATTSDTVQIFSSVANFPPSEDCGKILGIPQRMREQVKQRISRSSGDLEHFYCYVRDNQKYFGYLLQKLPSDPYGLQYMLLEKYMELDAIKLPTPESAIMTSGLTLDKYLSTPAQSIFVFNDYRSVLLKAGDLTEAKAINDETLATARAAGTLTFSLGTPDTVTNLRYLKELGMFICASTPVMALQKPLLPLGAVTLGLALLTVVLLSVALGRAGKALTAKIARVGEVVKQLGEDQLEDPAVLSKPTEILDTRDGDLGALNLGLQDMAKALGSTVSTRLDETARRNFTESNQITLGKLQQKLLPLPSDMPESRFLDIASYLIPHRNGCTDFYDILRVDKDNIAVVLLKSSLKGPAAIKAAAETESLIREGLISRNERPGRVLMAANTALCRRNSDELTLSVFVMILSEFTGNFIAANAGYVSPLRIHAGKCTPLIQSPGVELGVNSETPYEEFKGKIDFGDMFLSCNEGILETENSAAEKFGENKLEEIMSQDNFENAADVLIAINREVRSFVDEESEILADMSVICIKKSINSQERA